MIIVADTVDTPIVDATVPFQPLDFPEPTPAELFERVLSAPEALKPWVRCDFLSPEQADDIAQQLYPSSTRELEESLKLCALRYSRIDDHVVEIRNKDRSRHFRSLGALSYIPPGGLPTFAEFGWPPKIEPDLRRWVEVVNSGGIASRRILITGPSGYGKTAAPGSLAHELRLPLFRLDASACLQKNLGESEQMLLASLYTVSRLGRAIVLIDDLDRFNSVAVPTAGSDPTIARMSSILANWIDALPPRMIVIGTLKNLLTLTGGWQRRFKKTVELGLPRLNLDEPDSLNYRQAVLAALFRRFRLPNHAANATLLAKLAMMTCPEVRVQRGLPPLADAVARVDLAGVLGGFKAFLNTGADLETWMAQTLLLHTPRDNLTLPEQGVFWLTAAE